MSYRFTIQETVPAGIKRIALEQIDQALAQLTDPGADPDRAVRKARTCFKRLRAVLRLVRNEIGTELYRRENAFYILLGDQVKVELSPYDLEQGRITYRFKRQRRS